MLHVLFGLALMAPEARAQPEAPPAEAPEAEVPPAEAPEAEAPAPEAPPADLRLLEAEAIYRAGLELVAREQWAAGAAALGQVVAVYGDTPFAEEARRRLEVIAPLVYGPGGAKPAPSPAARNSSGQTEFIVSQGVAVPVFTGVLLSGSLGLLEESVTAPVLFAIAGLGAGIGGSVALSNRYPVSTGQAMAVLTGEILGTTNGVGLSTALNLNGVQAALGPPMIGFVLGTGAGAVAAVKLDPSAGQMCLLRSGASWGAAFTGLSFLYAPAADSGAVRMTLGTDLGAAAGAGLATALHLSRGRVNLINLGGYAGGVTVAGLGLIATSGDLEPAQVGVATSAGAVAGLVAGALLTRNMPDEALARMPTGALFARDGGRWRLGMPLPSLAISPVDGSPMLGLRLAEGAL